MFLKPHLDLKYFTSRQLAKSLSGKSKFAHLAIRVSQYLCNGEGDWRAAPEENRKSMDKGGAGLERREIKQFQDIN